MKAGMEQLKNHISLSFIKNRFLSIFFVTDVVKVHIIYRGDIVYKVYQVQIGDTLETIARKSNTDINTLQEINMNLNNLTPGMNIIVPSNNQQLYDSYTVKQGDSMYAIARRFGTTLEDLLSINGIDSNDYIYPNQTILVPKGNRTIYVTKENDTMQQVLNRLQITPETLLSQNEQIFLLPDQVLVYTREGNM